MTKSVRGNDKLLCENMKQNSLFDLKQTLVLHIQNAHLFPDYQDLKKWTKNRKKKISKYNYQSYNIIMCENIC